MESLIIQKTILWDYLPLTAFNMPIPSLCGIGAVLFPLLRRIRASAGRAARTRQNRARCYGGSAKAAVAPDGLGGRLRFVVAVSKLGHDLVQRQAALAQQHHQMEDQIARFIAKLVVIFDFWLR